MAVLGLISSPGILLAIPGSVLIGFAFAAAGLAVTTYLRDFADFQLIQLVMLPMYLFATTFYPLSTYPGAAAPADRGAAALPDHPARARARARLVHARLARAGRLPDRLRDDRALDRHPPHDAHAAELTRDRCSGGGMARTCARAADQLLLERDGVETGVLGRARAGALEAGEHVGRGLGRARDLAEPLSRDAEQRERPLIDRARVVVGAERPGVERAPLVDQARPARRSPPAPQPSAAAPRAPDPSSSRARWDSSRHRLPVAGMRG